jgi:UDP-glucuronate 4-epimerase
LRRMDNQKTVFITGIAGFIGFHVAERLLREGWNLIGLDNLNSYYDPALKLARLAQLGLAIPEHFRESSAPFSNADHSLLFYYGDLANRDLIFSIFEKHHPDYVIHLAAQAGVRYSIDHPEAYVASNLVGFGNMLEGCRKFPPKHFVYASSSSVYGLNSKVPFSTSDPVDQPVSLYAATKKSNELMAHSYSHLFGIPSTGLRFFTVYGPWGRPDMAYFSFSEKILARRSIQVFNHGKLSRDFTYIDDIVEGILRLLPLAPESKDGTPYRLMNIGNNAPVNLLEFIETLENELGHSAQKEYVDMQAGDVLQTWADSSDLWELTAFRPQTSLRDGLRKFAAWYKSYYADPKP